MKLLIAIMVMSMSLSVYAAKRKTFVGHSCSGTDTGYKTARKACKSGRFAGKEVTQCKKKRRKGWKVKRTLTCNSDGAKKGIYVGNCGGAKASGSTLKKACATGKYVGKTLVKCKKGKEKKKQYCGDSDNNTSKAKYKIFVGKCGGTGTKYKTNLNRACKDKSYTDKTLVKCTNKCVKRRGLKCIKKQWKMKKLATCKASGKADKSKTCDPTQHASLVKIISDAAVKASVLKSKASAAQRGQSKKMKKRLKHATKVLGKIAKKLKSKKVKLVCGGNKGRCSSHATAWTLWGGGAKVRVCDGYWRYSHKEKVGVMIHELSHNFKTRDGIDFSKSNPPKDGKGLKWHKNAETYEYWNDHGFCVPGVDC